MKQKFSPPFLYKVSIILMLITLLLPVKRQIPVPYNFFGVLLFVAGAYIAIDTKKLFKRTQTPVSHLANPVKLHTNGIFGFTRNPMYLGISLGLAGIAVMTGILYNLIFALVYLLIMDIFFVRKEEQKLEKEFGDMYLEYKKKTRRWL